MQAKFLINFGVGNEHIYYSYKCREMASMNRQNWILSFISSSDMQWENLPRAESVLWIELNSLEHNRRAIESGKLFSIFYVFCFPGNGSCSRTFFAAFETHGELEMEWDKGFQTSKCFRDFFLKSRAAFGVVIYSIFVFFLRNI